MRLFQAGYHGAIEFARANGQVPGKQNSHHLFTEFRKGLRDLKLFFQWVVINQYFHILWLN